MVNQFTALGRDPRVAFLGNVTVGRDVRLPELRAFYNAVPPSPRRAPACTLLTVTVSREGRRIFRACARMCSDAWGMLSVRTLRVSHVLRQAIAGHGLMLLSTP